MKATFQSKIQQAGSRTPGFAPSAPASTSDETRTAGFCLCNCTMTADSDQAAPVESAAGFCLCMCTDGDASPAAGESAQAAGFCLCMCTDGDETLGGLS